jgi:ParB-like chromosome segregation protein Spo0J
MPPRKRKAPPGPQPRIHPNIGGTLVALADLNEYYENPNVGDVDKIAHSLDHNGQYKPITANLGTYTGRPNEILAGNHTFKAAQQLDWPDIAVSFVDVDDVRAAIIVADDNHTAELAKRDDAALAKLLGRIPLEESTFTEDDLAKLLDKTPDEGDAAEEADDEPVWGVIITCRDEAQQLDLIERLDAEGHDVRAMVR